MIAGEIINFSHPCGENESLVVPVSSPSDVCDYRAMMVRRCAKCQQLVVCRCAHPTLFDEEDQA